MKQDSGKLGQNTLVGCPKDMRIYLQIIFDDEDDVKKELELLDMLKVNPFYIYKLKLRHFMSRNKAFL